MDLDIETEVEIITDVQMNKTMCEIVYDTYANYVECVKIM